MAEAGATPVQEIAFTLANGADYVRAALAAGLAVDDFAPRLSFFFVARTTLIEEVAKFRAARRMWARLMREEFGAKDPKSWMLRFHTQTAGVQLTAQQPEVNLIRVAVQALGAALGGTQSLHSNAYDEAIALPSEKAARLALRTQQVLAYETDLTAIVDPFAGSYAVEALTDRIEREIDAGDRVVVGVNRFNLAEEEPYQPLRVDPEIETTQGRRLATLRAERDNPAVEQALSRLRQAAAGTANVLYPLKEALSLRVTVGEVCHALREVWGRYQPVERF